MTKPGRQEKIARKKYWLKPRELARVTPEQRQQELRRQGMRFLLTENLEGIGYNQLRCHLQI